MHYQRLNQSGVLVQEAQDDKASGMRESLALVAGTCMIVLPSLYSPPDQFVAARILPFLLAGLTDDTKEVVPSPHLLCVSLLLSVVRSCSDVCVPIQKTSREYTRTCATRRSIERTLVRHRLNPSRHAGSKDDAAGAATAGRHADKRLAATLQPRSRPAVSV
jgi:hypothetical protein